MVVLRRKKSFNQLTTNHPVKSSYSDDSSKTSSKSGLNSEETLIKAIKSLKLKEKHRRSSSRSSYNLKNSEPPTKRQKILNLNADMVLDMEESKDNEVKSRKLQQYFDNSQNPTYFGNALENYPQRNGFVPQFVPYRIPQTTNDLSSTYYDPNTLQQYICYNRFDNSSMTPNSGINLPVRNQNFSQHFPYSSGDPYICSLTGQGTNLNMNALQFTKFTPSFQHESNGNLHYDENFNYHKNGHIESLSNPQEGHVQNQEDSKDTSSKNLSDISQEKLISKRRLRPHERYDNDPQQKLIVERDRQLIRIFEQGLGLTSSEDYEKYKGLRLKQYSGTDIPKILDELVRVLQRCFTQIKKLMHTPMEKFILFRSFTRNSLSILILNPETERNKFEEAWTKLEKESIRLFLLIEKDSCQKAKKLVDKMVKNLGKIEKNDLSIESFLEKLRENIIKTYVNNDKNFGWFFNVDHYLDYLEPCFYNYLVSPETQHTKKKFICFVMIYKELKDYALTSKNPTLKLTSK